MLNREIPWCGSEVFSLKDHDAFYYNKDVENSIETMQNIIFILPLEAAKNY